MADLTITAANVLPGSNAVTENGLLGATVTAGQAVYKEAATGTWKLSDADSATAEVRTVGGIALNGGAHRQFQLLAQRIGQGFVGDDHGPIAGENLCAQLAVGF